MWREFPILLFALAIIHFGRGLVESIVPADVVENYHTIELHMEERLWVVVYCVDIRCE
jgi:hypothetical protein